MSKKNRDKGGGMPMGLIVGLAVGVAVGVLVAPQAGAQLRRQLGSRLSELTARSNALDAWRQEAQLYLDAAREQVREAIAEGRQTASQTRMQLTTRFEDVKRNPDSPQSALSSPSSVVPFRS